MLGSDQNLGYFLFFEIRNWSLTNSQILFYCILVTSFQKMSENVFVAPLKQRSHIDWCFHKNGTHLQFLILTSCFFYRLHSLKSFLKTLQTRVLVSYYSFIIEFSGNNEKSLYQDTLVLTIYCISSLIFPENIEMVKLQFGAICYFYCSNINHLYV